MPIIYPDINGIIRIDLNAFFPSSKWSVFVKGLLEWTMAQTDPEIVENERDSFVKAVATYAVPFRPEQDPWEVLVLALSRFVALGEVPPAGAVINDDGAETYPAEIITSALKELYEKAETPAENLRFYVLTTSVVEIVCKIEDENGEQLLTNWWNTPLNTHRYFELLYPNEEGKLPEVTVSDVEITDPPFVFLIERLMDRDGMNAQGGEWHLKPNADEARVPDCSWSWSFLLRANARRLVSGFGFPSEWKAEWSFLGFLWLLGVFWVLAALLGIVWAVYSRHF